MTYLYPGVDLQEVVVAILVHHELNRAGIAVLHMARYLQGITVEGLPDVVIQPVGGSKLDHLQVMLAHSNICNRVDYVHPDMLACAFYCSPSTIYSWFAGAEGCGFMTRS